VTDLAPLAGEPFCYVTARGRKTGRRHTIEIWFGLSGRTLYLLSGGGRRSDWVRNIIAHPEVGLRLGDEELRATGRIVSDPAEDALARRLLLEKYQPGSGEDLSDWGRKALPVALDVIEG
jgi:deazaflavin-dependent oxidoreductase (nitroreductase family)